MNPLKLSLALAVTLFLGSALAETEAKDEQPSNIDKHRTVFFDEETHFSRSEKDNFISLDFIARKFAENLYTGDKEENIVKHLNAAIATERHTIDDVLYLSLLLHELESEDLELNPKLISLLKSLKSDEDFMTHLEITRAVNVELFLPDSIDDWNGKEIYVMTPPISDDIKLYGANGTVKNLTTESDEPNFPVILISTVTFEQLDQFIFND